MSLLELRNISKSYGHVDAVRNVTLELHAGEVHGLLGDNGAGKSTLLKIAAGAVQPDRGEIRLYGDSIRLESPSQARRNGIETVYQDLALAEERSCAANVFMGREMVRAGVLGRFGVLDRRAMDEKTRSEFEDLAVPVTEVRKPVRLLSGGQRQGVAIARAAIWAKQLLLLDEPTAALGVRQRAMVTTLVSSLRARNYGLLLISHDVPEVLETADRVTVMRLGSRVATRRVGDIDLKWVVGAMVGEVEGDASDE